MTITGEQHEGIYRIRRKYPIAEPFFRHLTELQHNMRETSLNVVETYSGLNKKSSLDLMSEIAETGVARIGGGGGGVASYLAWADGVDVREIGRGTNDPLR